MAYILPPKSQKKDDQQQDTRNGKPVGGGGAAFSPAPISPNRGGGVGRPESPNAQGGGSPMAGNGQFGRYVSLGEYMGQNQKQANQMANAVGNAAQNAATKAQGDIGKLETSFNNSLKQATKITNGANATSMPGGRDLSTASPEQYKAVDDATAAAAQRNKGLTEDGGVQTQVRDVYNKSTQTSGEGLWDAAQAGQAGGGRFAKLSAKYSNLGQSLADANTRAGKLYDLTEESNREYDESLTPQEDSRKVGITTTAEKYREEDAARKEAAGDQRDSEVTSMSRERWANLHGMTLEQWIANGENPPF